MQFSIGLSCSAVNNTCQCSSINYWNGTSCIPLLYPGQSCTTSSQCISSASCLSAICTCDTNYYYSTSIGQCTAQLSYLTSCTLGNYQCLNNTTCYDLLSPPAVCSCDPTYYYYDGSRCSAYATYGQTCAAATYGPYCSTNTSSLICTGSMCNCSSTTYYNGSSCISYVAAGFYCTSTSQCVTNSYCSSLQVCTCSTSYYFDTTTGNCLAVRNNGQACTLSVQCATNMICTSLQCQCTANTYLVSPNCVSRISYGGTCSASILCDTTLGLVCTSLVCTCSPTQYWSTLSNGTQICATLRALGQSCTANSDCVNSATSVKCVSSICECDSSGYYLDQTNVVCLPLKVLGALCTATYHFQCASFNCDSTGTCVTAIPSTIISNVTQATSNVPARQCDTIKSIWIILISIFYQIMFFLL